MNEFPYKQTFAFTIKPVVSAEKDKYLSIASLEQIRAFLPTIDTVANHDLLPIAFNALTPNRVNKNDDVIDTATALSIYKNFIYKQINVEHKRSNVIGCILTAGFSEFGTDKPLTEEQVKELKGPFNVTLGGILWRVVNGALVDFVEDSNDPASDNFLDISASWELGFTDYKLVLLPEGQKNIENGEIISDAAEIEKLKKNLRALGGSGKVGTKRIYRMPSENVTPLGIGLTEKPAADVKGVATELDNTQVSAEYISAIVGEKLQEINESLANEVLKGFQTIDWVVGFGAKAILSLLEKGKIKLGANAKDILTNFPEFCEKNKLNEKIINECIKRLNSLGILDKFEEKTEKKENINESFREAAKEAAKSLTNSLNNISQASNLNVNEERKPNIMVLNSIKDITDENLKQCSATVVSDFISNQLREKSESWVAEKNKLDTQISKATEDYKKATEEYTKLQENLKTVQATVETLQKEKADREAVEKFNSRMAEINEAFELDDEVRAEIVDEVKALVTDEAFAKFKKKASVLFKGFKKGDKNKQDKPVDKKDMPNDSIAAVVDKVVDAGEKDKATLPNTATPEKQSLKERMKNVFGKEGLEVKL